MTAFLQSRRLAKRLASAGLVRFARRVFSSLVYRVVYRGDHVERIRGGNHFTEKSARKLPIVVVVARGLEEGAAERLADEVECAQLSARSFRPLFVIDTADFAPFRQRGYVVERVMRREELATINPHDDHDLYIKSRLEMIAHRYRTSSVVTLGRGDLGRVREALSGEPIQVAEG